MAPYRHGELGTLTTTAGILGTPVRNLLRQIMEKKDIGELMTIVEPTLARRIQLG
jgi:hypothetical protein